MEVVYRPSMTMKAYHKDDSFVRLLVGPIGSGKSVASVIEMLLKSFNQQPDSTGRRCTRWAIIRTAYRLLQDTTIKTFFDWVPRELGKWKAMDLIFEINTPHPSGDGTHVHAEFLFRSLEKPSDVNKLLSLELTGGFINEAKDLPKSIFDMLLGRVGRYPSNRDVGPTWHGVIMDTNPPDTDHWIYDVFEVQRPPNFKVFKQPSGLSPEAENIDNLPFNYYQNLMQGKDQEFINVYVHGKYGMVNDGKPVFPEYKDDVHAVHEHYSPLPNEPIFVGIDFGLTPAAVFIQETAAGRWFAFDELVCKDMGADNFSKLLNKMINGKYSGYRFRIFGDPAGDQRAQTDEVTPFQILYANGINATPTYTNDFILRREAVASILSRLDFAGNPSFAVTPGAPNLRKAMSGGYSYKRVAVVGQERYKDVPDKGKYSHVADALQYACLGAGLGGRLIESDNFNTDIDYSQFDRLVV